MTETPADVHTPSMRSADSGQMDGSIRLTSSAGADATASGSTSACRGPAGWADLLMTAYIRSGALTPSRPRPLASTMRVASHSQSRASVSAPGTSSPWGRTRQES